MWVMEFRDFRDLLSKKKKSANHRIYITKQSQNKIPKQLHTISLCQCQNRTNELDLTKKKCRCVTANA